MKKQQFKAGIASMLLGILSPAALFVPSVSAATTTWGGHHPIGSYDGLMSTACNWIGCDAPGSGDTVVFSVDGINQEIENDFAGLSSLTLDKIIFSGNNTFESSKSFSITGEGIGITSGIEAIMTGAGGDHKVATSVTLGGDATFKTSGVDTLEVGGTGTVLDLGSNDLTLLASGGTITLAGSIDGSGKLMLTGDGTVNMLATAATGFSGAVEISSGVFATTAETEGNIILSGGTLKGNSDLLGTITMSAGTIAPGNSPGCLGSADLAFTGGSYDVEINGNTVCTQYDSMTVVGAVDLGSATTLNISRLDSFKPKVNDTFAIIVNDAADVVKGTFKGLADGASVTVAGYSYQINYNAGDGNDVVLLVKATPTTPATGIGSLLTSPLTAALSALAALGVVGGLKFAEQRRK